MEKRKLIWLTPLVLVLASGCTRHPISEPAAEAPAAEQRPAVPPPPQKLTRGEALYIRHCADCHGWEGAGGGPIAMLLNIPPPVLRNNEVLNRHSDADLVDRVLHGAALPLAEYADPENSEEITELLRHMRRLPSIPWERVDAGQGIYDELCVSCHGLYGHGDGVWSSNIASPPADLSAAVVQDRYSDAELAQLIAAGKGIMPGHAELLGADEIGQLVDYVRILSKGYTTYDRFCAVCHGTDGHPVELIFLDEAGLELDRTELPVFDATYFKTRTDEQLRPLVLHMLESNRASMPHFAGELEAGEVREILNYLRKLGPES